MNRLFLGALGLLFTATAAHAADESYDIRIQRPFKAGQSYGLSATNTSRSAETVSLPNGQDSRTSVFRRVILDADVHVDQVDAKGAEAIDTLVIHKLTLQVAEADQAGQQTFPKEVLPANTQIVVIMQEGGQPLFATKKAGVLPDDAMLALQQGFRRITINDAVYGTTEKKKIGDSWALNTKAMSGDKTDPNYVDPSLITGSTLLKAQRTFSGLPCLQLDTTMAIKNLNIDGAKEATMSTQITVNLPVDATKPTLAWNVHSTTHIVKEEKPMGRSIVLHTEDSELIHEATVTPK